MISDPHIGSGVMQDQQRDQLSEEENPTSAGSNSYQTPVEAESRKTGVDAHTDAKPTAVPESGSSDQLTEGGGNQGTEKR